jgi:hypothetical protein
MLKVVNNTIRWYEECIFKLITNDMFRPIHAHHQVDRNSLRFHYVNQLWCGDLNISLCYAVSKGYRWREGERNQNYMLLWWRRGKVSSWGSLGVVLLPWYMGPPVGRISPTCIWSRVYYRVPDSALGLYLVRWVEGPLLHIIARLHSGTLRVTVNLMMAMNWPKHVVDY